MQVRNEGREPPILMYYHNTHPIFIKSKSKTPSILIINVYNNVYLSGSH